MLPKAKLRGTLRSWGNVAHCFPQNQSFERFVIPPNLKIEETTAKVLFSNIGT